MVARGGEGFLPVRTHLGCLVAAEEHVMRSDETDDVPLLEDFLAQSRAGGRLPIIRGIRPNRAALYRSRGLVVRRSGEVLAVKLGAASPESVARTPMGRNAGALARVGAVLTMGPSPITVAVLEQLRGLDPGLDPDRLGEVIPAIVRIHGQMVAWALVRSHDDGTVLTMERARVTPGAPATVVDFLLVRLVEHAREQGYRRLVLGDEQGSALPPSATLPERNLPVVHEPRYTARPGGLRGLWAALSDRILTWSGKSGAGRR